MPIYEYKCNECDKTYEFFLKLDEKDKTFFCVDCKSELEKIISSNNFIFNGGYTYKNSYGLKEKEKD